MGAYVDRLTARWQQHETDVTVDLVLQHEAVALQDIQMVLPIIGVTWR